jgi:hypothetical protein
MATEDYINVDWVLTNYYPGIQALLGGEVLFTCRQCGTAVVDHHDALESHVAWHKKQDDRTGVVYHRSYNKVQIR